MAEQVAFPPTEAVQATVAVPPAKSTTGSYVVETSMPDKLVRHDISDEELDLLDASKSDNLTDAMWTLVGICMGAIPSSLAALWESFSPEINTPLSPFDLFQVIVAFAAGAVAFALWKVHAKNRKKAGTGTAETRYP